MLYRLYENELGEKRYQPYLPEYRKALYHDTCITNMWWHVTDPFGWLEPVLYRSQKRAERVAARELHRINKRFRRA